MPAPDAALGMGRGDFMRRVAAVAALAVLALAANIGGAAADVVIGIDKSSQRMTVLVNGAARHSWLVSTGLGGGPPSGTYGPERMERKWYSHKFNWSPMPHAIFFHEGYAIHGTMYVSRLGNRASHGCVRLHPANAATLFALVQAQGIKNTRIVVSNSGSVLAKAKPRLMRARLMKRVPPQSASADPRAPVQVPQATTTGPDESGRSPQPVSPEKL